MGSRRICAFGDWLLSLSIISSRFIHVLAGVRFPSSSKVESYASVWIDHICLSIHPKAECFLRTFLPSDTDWCHEGHFPLPAQDKVSKELREQETDRFGGHTRRVREMSSPRHWEEGRGEGQLGSS